MVLFAPGLRELKYDRSLADNCPRFARYLRSTEKSWATNGHTTRVHIKPSEKYIYRVSIWNSSLFLQGVEDLEEENMYLKEKLKQLEESDVSLIFNVLYFPRPS